MHHAVRLQGQPFATAQFGIAPVPIRLGQPAQPPHDRIVIGSASQPRKGEDFWAGGHG